jgi:hypothetical protein
MAYVGTPIDTRNTFQSLQGKRFNGDGSTTAFTLDVAPSSTLDIEVFVGNVRQDPNSAYTLSGTTLTFTGAPPSGTNNIYVVHQAKSVGTIDPPATETVAKTFSGGLTSSGALVASSTAQFDTIGVGAAKDLGTGLHIKTADSSASVATDSDELVIEGSGASGMSILSGASSNGKIAFNDSGGNSRGAVIYEHDGDNLRFQTAATDALKIDSAGHVTQPLQSFFVATPTSNSADIAADTTHTIIANSEILDRNGDYNTANGTFTAPVTGAYALTMNVGIGDYDYDNNYSAGFINTSNRRWTIHFLVGNALSVDGTLFVTGTCIVDMDANDTVTFQFRNDQGAQQPFIAQEFTFLSGYLLG